MKYDEKFELRYSDDEGVFSEFYETEVDAWNEFEFRAGSPEVTSASVSRVMTVVLGSHHKAGK